VGYLKSKKSAPFAIKHKFNSSVRAKQAQAILLFHEDIFHPQILLPLPDPAVPELPLLYPLLFDVFLERRDVHILLLVVDDQHLLRQMWMGCFGFGDRLAHRLVLDALKLTGRTGVVLVLNEVW